MAADTVDDYESFERIAEWLPQVTDAVVESSEQIATVRETLAEVSGKLDTVIAEQAAAAPALRAIIEKKQAEDIDALVQARITELGIDSPSASPWFSRAQKQAIAAAVVIIVGALAAWATAQADPLSDAAVEYEDGAVALDGWASEADA